MELGEIRGRPLGWASRVGLSSLGGANRSGKLFSLDALMALVVGVFSNESSFTFGNQSTFDLVLQLLHDY